ncbi:MAG: exodeoxyribonuclease VII large subunit, partial [Caldilineaceae bacterium]
MNPITISAVTTHIVNLFEGDERLRDVWLLGEVSNWKKAASGHIYFSLKDAGASLSGVMWKGNAFRHTWLPREGDQVMAHGYVGVYPERGSYQFYADQMRPAGKGQLYARFEALKAKLAAEGLFDPERKRPIPVQPKRVGIVTSAGAAALRDILRTLSLRWPLVDVLLFPTLVQGGDAPIQIVRAIQAANRYSIDIAPIDTLIVGRGGGSIEDLWAFNDEGVARAIVASAIPVIAGVGHEVDFSIADFVADLRAATPTAAASAAVPDRAEVMANLWAVERGLAERAENLLDFQRARLDQLAARLDRVHPRRQLDLSRQRLEDRIQ